MNWREAIIKNRTCHCCKDCTRFQDEKDVRSSSAQNYRTPQSCRTSQDERDDYSKNYVIPENGNCGGESGYRPKTIPDPKIHMDHKMTKILRDFRHRAASFMEEQEPMASSDDEDVCRTYTRRKNRLREGTSVRRTPKLDYSPQSNFLKKMKREKREFSPNSFINCGRTDNRLDDVPLLSHKCSLDDLGIPLPENLPSEKCSHKEKPTPRSEMSSVRDPCTCYRTWRPKLQDFRSDQKKRGNGNYDEVPDFKMFQELCNDEESECEEKTATKTKGKSRRLSRVDQKKRTERRGKKKYGEGGSIKEVAFEPSLKRPHPNSCERCWRFASPSRSPVNKPNQRFDPNFRRTHSETTFTNADTGRSESSRDYKNKDVTAKRWEADREIKERLLSSHTLKNSKTFLNTLKSTTERPASAEPPSGKRTVKLKDKERKSPAKTKQAECSKSKAPRPGRDMLQKYSASSDKPKTGEHLVQKQDPLQCSPSMFSKSRKSSPSSWDSSPKSATSGRSKSKKKLTKGYKQKQRPNSIDRMLGTSGGLDDAFQTTKTCCCNGERRKLHHTFDQTSSCENFQSFFGNNCSQNRADHGVWNEPALPPRPRTRCSHSPPNSHRHIYSNEDFTLKMNELEDDYKPKCCCFLDDSSPHSALRGKCPENDYFVKRSPVPLWEPGMCWRENANAIPGKWKTYSKCKPSSGATQNDAADFADNPRKYCVFYMNKSNDNKGDDDVEVLIEELTEEKGAAKGACVNRVNTPRGKRSSSTADSRNEALRNKMKKMKELRLDSMALRFQKGVAEKCTRPESNRVLYF